MTLPQALAIAEKHSNNGAEMQTSALMSIYQAKKLYDMGRYEYVWGWIIRSIEYSVGRSHPDYKYVLDSYKIEQS